MAGQLSVTIVAAQQLHDEDSFGGSNDPYVEVYIDDDYKQRTATVSNTNNPEWNETFQFRVEKNQDNLHIKVYDDDVGSRDTIGSAKIPLEDVKRTGRFDQWIKLPAHLGLTSHGQVHVIMNFRP